MTRHDLTPDPWIFLQPHTQARIAMGRAGGSLPTSQWLKFSADHAAARDAVHSALDFDQLANDLRPAGIATKPSDQIAGLPILRVQSRITDRQTYLHRPDLGCQLNDPSHAILEKWSQSHPADCDVAIILADGLSALATQLHAPNLTLALIPLLQQSNFCLAPLVLAKFARVALQDQIGHLLHARLAIILLGERPGLAAADSLGAYLVFNPKPGNTTAHRNCVSNIRPAGLPPIAAAHTLHYLIAESLRRQISGISLKDERSGHFSLPP